MGSLLPTLATRPEMQVRYASSAGIAKSEVLRGVRDRAYPKDDPELFYVEWAADRAGCLSQPCDHVVGTPGCALDREDLWGQANPALGRRITLETMRFFRRSLPPLEFAREFLGWWDDAEDIGLPAIDPHTWGSLVGSTPPRRRDTVFALDVAPDHSSATVAAAWSTPDGSWVQLADCRPVSRGSLVAAPSCSPGGAGASWSSRQARPRSCSRTSKPSRCPGGSTWTRAPRWTPRSRLAA